MDLETAITGILQREGAAFTNDAQDAPTKWGVTLEAFQEFMPGATLANLQELDVDGARAFYRWRFRPFAILQVDDRAWRNILDAVTLHGPTGAVKAVQTAAGVKVDGQLGPKTAAAVHAMASAAFCLAFADARVSICVEDIRRDVTQHYGAGAIEATDLKYLRGWMRRIIEVGFACLAIAVMVGCASTPARPPAAPLEATNQPMPILIGINDGFHGPIPADLIAHYCEWTRDVIVRAPVLNAEQADALVASLRPCPRLHALLLVEQADDALVRQLTTYIQAGAQPLDVWGVELGNELDLAGLTPAQFAAFVGTGRETLRAAGYAGRILTGGIYTVDDHRPQDFLAYIRQALDVCPDCIVGLHWYGDTSDYWLSRVQALGLPVAITEFGLPSCTPAQEAAQVVYIQEKMAAFRRTGNVVLAIPYQRPSAQAPCNDTDASHLAHFGFQRPDGSWKPVDAAFFGSAQ